VHDRVDCRRVAVLTSDPTVNALHHATPTQSRASTHRMAE
jgi:hypothetical protein